MGPLLTIIGLAIFAVIWWRRLTRARDVANVVLKKPQARPETPKAVTLKKDPKTGVYREKPDE
ncbi:hypothetical protein [Bauldia sp.]|uniref:hypothetical protein n=1 Tax=Bauldia sp. TaxID=2575872 RepID=UPI003BACF857